MTVNKSLRGHQIDPNQKLYGCYQFSCCVAKVVRWSSLESWAIRSVSVRYVQHILRRLHGTLESVMLMIVAMGQSLHLFIPSIPPMTRGVNRLARGAPIG